MVSVKALLWDGVACGVVGRQMDLANINQDEMKATYRITKETTIRFSHPQKISPHRDTISGACNKAVKIS